MKYRFLVMAFVASTLTFAQKKEFKKIGKAIDQSDFKEASTIFEEIEEGTVEDKYKAEYTFYKAYTLLGNPTQPKAKGNELRSVIDLLNESKELGYPDTDKVAFLEAYTSDAIFNEAKNLLSSGKNKEALELVNYLLVLDPSNDKMRENSANLSYQLGDYEAAKLKYEKLLEDDYTGIEESFVATSKDDGSIVTFPTLNSAKIAETAGRYENARRQLSDSNLGSMITSLAWIYQNEGDVAKAKTLVDNMLSKYPKDNDLNLAKADLFLLTGEDDKYEAAIKSMNDEIKDPLVFENLGIAAGKKNNWDQAINYYQKSLNLKDDNYVSQNNLAAAYLNKGNLETTTSDEQKELYLKAADHFERVRELKPDLNGIVETLVSIYDFLGLNEKSTKLKEKM